MTYYLIDTNVISEIRKGTRRMNPSVRRWLNTVNYNRLLLSAITIQELENGILQKERRDVEQGVILRHWLESVLSDFKGRILSVDQDVALATARLHVPDPAPMMDALIGATAIVNGCTVVTRNTADFERFGVAVLNPWEYGKAT